MSNYRVTFLKNNIISCVETDQKLQQNEQSYYFKDPETKITCVLIHAPDKDEAIEGATHIAQKAKSNNSWPGIKY